MRSKSGPAREWMGSRSHKRNQRTLGLMGWPCFFMFLQNFALGRKTFWPSPPLRGKSPLRRRRRRLCEFCFYDCFVFFFSTCVHPYTKYTKITIRWMKTCLMHWIQNSKDTVWLLTTCYCNQSVKQVSLGRDARNCITQSIQKSHDDEREWDNPIFWNVLGVGIGFLSWWWWS